MLHPFPALFYPDRVSILPAIPSLDDAGAPSWPETGAMAGESLRAAVHAYSRVTGERLNPGDLGGVDLSGEVDWLVFLPEEPSGVAEGTGVLWTNRRDGDALPEPQLLTALGPPITPGSRPGYIVRCRRST